MLHHLAPSRVRIESRLEVLLPLHEKVLMQPAVRTGEVLLRGVQTFEWSNFFQQLEFKQGINLHLGILPSFTICLCFRVQLHNWFRAAPVFPYIL